LVVVVVVVVVSAATEDGRNLRLAGWLVGTGWLEQLVSNATTESVAEKV